MEKLDIMLTKIKQALFAQNQRNVIDIIWAKPLEIVSSYCDCSLLILLDMDSGWEFEKFVSDMLYDLELEYDVSIDAVFMAEAELGSIRCDQPIFENLLLKGYHLCNLTKLSG